MTRKTSIRQDRANRGRWLLTYQWYPFGTVHTLICASWQEALDLAAYVEETRKGIFA